MVFRLEIEGIAKAYGRQEVLSATSLALAPRELLCVLGPSGCGKSTLLGIVAGLVEPSAGSVRLDGVDVTALPSEKRGMPMVFQDHLLFPAMTAGENVAFGLVMRRVAREDIARRVREALAAVRLEGMESRLPSELSGGQRQRVALARALVLRPAVLLLDEPFSNLDAGLRLEMRELIMEMRDALGFAALVVTHDPQEALGLGDRVAVMQRGAVAEIDAPAALYARAKTQAVAALLGPASFLPLTRGHAGLRLRDGTPVASEGDRAGELALCLRPEILRFAGGRELAGTGMSLPAQLGKTYFTGAKIVAEARTTCGTLRVDLDVTADLEGLARQSAVGDLCVAWDPSRAFVVGAEPVVSELELKTGAP